MRTPTRARTLGSPAHRTSRQSLADQRIRERWLAMTGVSVHVRRDDYDHDISKGKQRPDAFSRRKLRERFERGATEASMLAYLDERKAEVSGWYRDAEDRRGIRPLCPLALVRQALRDESHTDSAADTLETELGIETTRANAERLIAAKESHIDRCTTLVTAAREFLIHECRKAASAQTWQ